MFCPPSESAVQELIVRYPLSWVISPKVSPVAATPLPLLGNYDSSGKLISLTGHIARRNPHCALLQEDGRVELLFQGANGYLSPSWQANPAWGPTWNYATVQISADIVMQADRTEKALRRLVDEMEILHGGEWQVEQMGQRFDQLREQVIAFEARVISVRPRFKMGQDESAETLAAFYEALGDNPLTECMRRCNEERLQSSQ